MSNFSSKITSTITKVVFTFSLVALSCTNIFAQGMSVPANLQAALFKKLFTLNKTLSSKGTPKVLVVYTDASAGDRDEVVEAFKGAGMTVNSVKADAATSQLSSHNVVYIAPGASSVASACSKSGIFSVTAVPSYVEGGKATIGLGTEGGKPKIIVNINKAKEEGQDLSADLIKIARVIQ